MRSSLRLYLFMFAICFALASCAGTPTKSSETPSRVYDANLETVYNATIRAFQNLGLDLFEQNKENGYVEGGRPLGIGRGSETVGVFLENEGINKTKASIDNNKAIWGLLFAVDWTQRLFDQIEKEIKR